MFDLMKDINHLILMKIVLILNLSQPKAILYLWHTERRECYDRIEPVKNRPLRETR